MFSNAFSKIKDSPQIKCYVKQRNTKIFIGPLDDNFIKRLLLTVSAKCDAKQIN
jgi:hypothetical protein